MTGCSHDITATMSASVGYQPPCEDCAADLPYGALSDVRWRLEYDDAGTTAHDDVEWDAVFGEERTDG